jgi:hypothetical protein
MLKRTMRNCVLHTADRKQLEVKEAIDALLAGAKPADVPSRLCKLVISTMTQMQKDVILQRKDSLAAKIEIILGELQRDPQRYILDTPLWDDNRAVADRRECCGVNAGQF